MPPVQVLQYVCACAWHACPLNRSTPCALCRDDAPTILRAGTTPAKPGPKSAAWIESEAQGTGYSPATCAFVSRCIIPSEGKAAVQLATALLRAAFAAVPVLQTLFLASAQANHLCAADAKSDGATSSSSPNGSHGAPATATHSPLLSWFPRAAASQQLGLQLGACVRRAPLPALSVRRARVQDHDELLPLLQRAAARHPSLARLPDSCAPGEPFALTRLIGSQDQGNALVVAHQRGSERLVSGGRGLDMPIGWVQGCEPLTGCSIVEVHQAAARKSIVGVHIGRCCVMCVGCTVSRRLRC